MLAQPQPKPSPIDTPEVRSVFAQIRLIEKDEEEITVDNTRTNEAPTQPDGEGQPLADLADMIAYKMDETVIVGVRKRFKVRSQETATQEDLNISITLR